MPGGRVQHIRNWIPESDSLQERTPLQRPTNAHLALLCDGKQVFGLRPPPCAGNDSCKEETARPMWTATCGLRPIGRQGVTN